jgi:hypothetical protein
LYDYQQFLDKMSYELKQPESVVSEQYSFRRYRDIVKIMERENVGI